MDGIKVRLMRTDIGEIKLSLEAIVFATHELKNAIQPCGSDVEIERLLQVAKDHIGIINQGDE